LNSNTRLFAIGLLFSALWASASAAGKIGLRSVEPLLLFNVRFALAGSLMLLYAHLVQRKPFPKLHDWKKLITFGALNTTLYLGFFILAIRQVSAGIGSLATATNPLLISILAALWMRRKIKITEWFSIALGLLGVGVATYPLLQNSTATVQGLLLMLASMLSYSIGTLYYSRVDWGLPTVVINAWQVFIGGILLLPFTFLFHKNGFPNQFNLSFWGAELWLVIPVSIISVQFWLYLLKIDAVKASLWLFLCPVFGFAYANILLNEPITICTVIGTALVIFGLYLGQKEKLLKKKTA
jgi:drug/metabolite transporter (DMT)-like permease